MSEFNNWKEINNTRKDHKCFGCNSVIPKGSKAKYHAGRNEGFFTTSHYCIPCDEFMTRNPDYFEEGIYRGDIGDAREEQERHGKELSA